MPGVVVFLTQPGGSPELTTAPRARAVGQALEEAYPGRFDAVLCDPLGGPGSSRLLRLVTGLYGPMIRLAPWAWGAVYHACDSRCGCC